MDGQIRKTESTKSQSFTARLSASKDFFPLSIELVGEAKERCCPLQQILAAKQNRHFFSLACGLSNLSYHTKYVRGSLLLLVAIRLISQLQNLVGSQLDPQNQFYFSMV